MRSLLNPRWIFLVNTLPVCLLFFLYGAQYKIIRSVLTPPTIELWLIFGLTLACLCLSNIVYAFLLIRKSKNISWVYALIAISVYIAFIYIHTTYLEQIIPFDVPRWMVANDGHLYVGTFLMPTLIHAIFILIFHFTPTHKKHNALLNFAYVISIPLGWYALIQILTPLRTWSSELSVHTFTISFVLTTVVFIFFLVRFIYILTFNKTRLYTRYQLAWKIPIALVFPVLGLLINNNNYYKILGAESGVFGDFRNPWFYVLAVLNGLFICLPSLNNKLYRVVLLIGRCITFSYVLYFFIVFLPFLPLSIAAIIAFGLGFLMLTPLLLFTIYLSELHKDYLFLKSFYATPFLVIVISVGFLVLPLSLTSSYLHDRAVLHQTLEYVYTPNYTKSYDISKKSLHYTLNSVKTHKEGSTPSFVFSKRLPYLSSYFNWLVLDNLTLSDNKIAYLEKVFFDTTSFLADQPSLLVKDSMVSISKISSNSRYDSSQNAWLSWIHLDITNHRDRENMEYSTLLNLPIGCWIIDYYLYVNNKKEPGILAEKKAAMWVFSQIRNIRQDPGILYYLSGNKVAFRVFPFTASQTRTTGIEFIHKEPISITIDTHSVYLGDSLKPYTPIKNNVVRYLSVKEKSLLKKVHRKPYFHFIIDISAEKKLHKKNFTDRITQFLKKNPLPNASVSKISFVNTYLNTTVPAKSWQSVYQTQTFEGGFFLEQAIKKILFKAYKENNDTYPIIIVVTDSMQDVILENDFSDLKITFPESDFFYHLDQNVQLNKHSLINHPSQVLKEDTLDLHFSKTVLEYTDGDFTTYLPDDHQPSIVLKKDLFYLSKQDIKPKSWLSALLMHGKWTSMALYPHLSQQAWLDLVKHSFVTKIMTPSTSYLVVENEAQKAMLKKKQDQVLRGNKSLDLGEEAQRMSEPNLWLVLIVVGSVFYFIRKKLSTVTL